LTDELHFVPPIECFCVMSCGKVTQLERNVYKMPRNIVVYFCSSMKAGKMLQGIITCFKRHFATGVRLADLSKVTEETAN